METTKRRPLRIRLKMAAVFVLPGSIVQGWLVFGFNEMRNLLPGTPWDLFCGFGLTPLFMLTSVVMWDSLRGYVPSEKPDGSHESL